MFPDQSIQPVYSTWWTLTKFVFKFKVNQWNLKFTLGSLYFCRCIFAKIRLRIYFAHLCFFFKLQNIIDLASILPNYVGMIISTGEQSSFVRVLRLLRLFRVLRLLRLLSFMKNVDVALELIIETLRQSTLILSVFMFFVFILIVLGGCIIYLCEAGDYTVSADYPHGEYLRVTADGYSLEPSPFDSIPTGMYWMIGTATGAGKF
jgi:hypothetical protein